MWLSKRQFQFLYAPLPTHISHCKGYYVFVHQLIKLRNREHLSKIYLCGLLSTTGISEVLFLRKLKNYWRYHYALQQSGIRTRFLSLSPINLNAVIKTQKQFLHAYKSKQFLYKSNGKM